MRVILSRAAVLVAMAALAVPAAAQEQGVAKGTVETSLGGGGSFPVGDFKDNANTGFNIGGRAAYYVTERIAVGGQITYDRFGASDELKQALSGIISDPNNPLAVDANFDMLQYGAYGKYNFMPAKRAMPYVKAFVGASSVKASGRAGPDEVNCAPPGCASAETWVTDFAAGGGVGVDVRFGEIFGGYADAHYNALFTEGSTTQYFSLQAGVIIYAN